MLRTLVAGGMILAASFAWAQAAPVASGTSSQPATRPSEQYFDPAAVSQALQRLEERTEQRRREAATQPAEDRVARALRQQNEQLAARLDKLERENRELRKDIASLREDYQQLRSDLRQSARAYDRLPPEAQGTDPGYNVGTGVVNSGQPWILWNLGGGGVGVVAPPRQPTIIDSTPPSARRPANARAPVDMTLRNPPPNHIINPPPNHIINPPPNHAAPMPNHAAPMPNHASPLPQGQRR